MVPSDAQLAYQDLPPVKLTQIRVESSLTQLHEMWIHSQSGVRKFEQNQLTMLACMNDLYWQFARKSHQLPHMQPHEMEQCLKTVGGRVEAAQYV